MWEKFRLALNCFFYTLIELPKQLLLWRNDRSILPGLPTIRSEQPSAVSSETEQQQQPLPMIQQLPLWRTERSIPQEWPTIRPEQPSAVSLETEQQQSLPMIQQQQPVNNHHDRVQIDNIMNMQWALPVVGASFAAISVILQALQTRATLPASTFPWFCMAVELAFLALLASVYMRRHYHKASLVMEHVAIFFCAVALFLVIWMTLHPPLNQISVAVFFIGFTTIILANRSLHDW